MHLVVSSGRGSLIEHWLSNWKFSGCHPGGTLILTTISPGIFFSHLTRCGIVALNFLAAEFLSTSVSLVNGIYYCQFTRTYSSNKFSRTKFNLTYSKYLKMKIITPNDQNNLDLPQKNIALS